MTVSDDQILKTIKKLGKEGVFAEPASAAAYAALAEIDYEEDEKIALIITGSGLKDPEAALRGRRMGSQTMTSVTPYLVMSESHAIE